MELRLKYKSAATLLLVSILLGCSFRNPDPITAELSSKGVVIVSKERAYLASTKFISREAESDENIKNLVIEHGYPTALSISSTLISAISARLYYSGVGSYFDMAKTSTGWLITGPFPLSDSEIRELEKLNIAVPISSQKEARSEDTVVSPSDDTVEKKIETPTTSAKERFTSPALPSTPQTSALEAEMTPKGDIVHYVTFNGESLSIIARWYTHERENAGKIGRLNKLKDANQLELGDVIVIPSYLIKNKKRFTEKALKELQSAVEKDTSRN